LPSTELDSATPETAHLEVVNPEAVNPEAVNPEAVNPEAVNPEAVNPEAVNPEAVNPEAVNPALVTAYPEDPSFDIPWEAGYSGLNDIIAAFNHARRTENGQLGSKVPPLVAPAQSTWNAMSEGERALWLINQERTARGLRPLHGLEKNVNDVAGAWAKWLIDNDQWGHNADGKTPWVRLDANGAIGACHDFLGVAENLWVRGTTDSKGVPLPIERAVYSWLYTDSHPDPKLDWGHRHAILWTPYTENSGPNDREGFLGIGHARGAYTMRTDKGPVRMPYTDMVVMNIFDPCSSWAYAAAPAAPPPPALVPVSTPKPPANTHAVSGQIRLPVWETISYQPFEVGTWGNGSSGWKLSDANGATGGEYTWAAATCRVYAGTYSGMAVGGGADGDRITCGDNYPNNARAWMIYGPFSLEGAIAAEMQATVWVYTEPYDDELCLVASTDRKVFNGVCVSGYSNGWVEERIDLNRVVNVGTLLEQPKVYVALAFISDESDTRPHTGVFVDDILVRKATAAPAAAASESEASVSTFTGVTVRDQAGHMTMTDRNGAFRLEGLAPGRHTLTLDLPGYDFYPRQISVDVAGQDIANLTSVGTSTVRYPLYLPITRRAPARANVAQSDGGEEAGDPVKTCGPTGCRLLHPTE
jgi:uncharacterized protein YkwD